MWETDSSGDQGPPAISPLNTQPHPNEEASV